eukprot:500285-Pleurochrysis_carterae.AAC.3
MESALCKHRFDLRTVCEWRPTSLMTMACAETPLAAYHTLCAWLRSSESGTCSWGLQLPTLTLRSRRSVQSVSQSAPFVAVAASTSTRSSLGGDGAAAAAAAAAETAVETALAVAVAAAAAAETAEGFCAVVASTAVLFRQLEPSESVLSLAALGPADRVAAAVTCPRLEA